MNRLTSIALLAWLALGAATAGAQTVDPSASELVFVTEQMGVPVEGRFQRWAAQVALDPRRPESGQVGLHIQTDSIAFAAPEVTAEAQRAPWPAPTHGEKARDGLERWVSVSEWLEAIGYPPLDAR